MAVPWLRHTTLRTPTETQLSHQMNDLTGSPMNEYLYIGTLCALKRETFSLYFSKSEF